VVSNDKAGISPLAPKQTGDHSLRSRSRIEGIDLIEMRMTDHDCGWNFPVGNPEWCPVSCFERPLSRQNTAFRDVRVGIDGPQTGEMLQRAKYAFCSQIGRAH